MTVRAPRIGSTIASPTAPTTTVDAETGTAAVSTSRSTRSKRRMPRSRASSAASTTENVGRCRFLRSLATFARVGVGTHEPLDSDGARQGLGATDGEEDERADGKQEQRDAADALNERPREQTATIQRALTGNDSRPSASVLAGQRDRDRVARARRGRVRDPPRAAELGADLPVDGLELGWRRAGVDGPAGRPGKPLRAGRGERRPARSRRRRRRRDVLRGWRRRASRGCPRRDRRSGGRARGPAASASRAPQPRRRRRRRAPCLRCDRSTAFATRCRHRSSTARAATARGPSTRTSRPTTRSDCRFARRNCVAAAAAWLIGSPCIDFDRSIASTIALLWPRFWSSSPVTLFSFS